MKEKNLTLTQIKYLVALMILIVLLINVISSHWNFRVDLTTEKRYSILPSSKNLLRNIDDQIYIEVYLDGDVNSGVKRLRNAVEDLILSMKSEAGRNLTYQFKNPIRGLEKEAQQDVIKSFASKGLMATSLSSESEDGLSNNLIFPCALVTYKGRQFAVNFLENQIGYTPEDAINHSIINLEYKFINSVRKLSLYRRQVVAFAEGHDELLPLETYDFEQTLKDNWFDVKRLNITQGYKIPESIDVLVIAAPSKGFEEREKFKIDQYLMRGGKILWLIDKVWADMDSLSNPSQMFMAEEIDYNLDDMLFNYGARINGDLIQDAQNYNFIPLEIGNGQGAPQTRPFPWLYYPVLLSYSNHTINKNLDPISSFFVSSVDTIRAEGIKKTVLLSTSSYSRALKSPVRVHLAGITEQPDLKRFTQQNLPVAVLLEGSFKSVFRNRINKAFLTVSDTIEDLSFKELSVETKQIIISDGDMIRNNLRADGSIWPLGYYVVTGQTFANRDFLLNCIEYMVDDSKIIESRNKEIKLRLLDRVRIKTEKYTWQLINVFIPLFVLIAFGFVYNMVRRNYYLKF